MSISLIIRSELMKLFKRKDVWLMLAMIGIPMLYALGAFFNASFIEYKASDKSYALRFVMNMFQFNYGVFIFFFITLLAGVKTLGSEIEDKSIMLSIPRVKKRGMIYTGKNIAMSIAVVAINLIFGLTCLLLYYLFLVHRVDLATKVLYVAKDLPFVLSNIIAIICFYLLLVQFASMLSTFLKPMVASVVGFITIAITMYLQQIPGVKYFVPGYYISMLSDGNGLEWLTLINYLICIGVLSIIFYSVGYMTFSRKDL
ncbi:MULTISPECIES: hypothetical protein [unclassified Fusibacter]|uniref:hypothetical protein n=1 Tax=unclassified Fusibacter TaxID=2624464 RepID=UPI001013675F|nr:MULTISPECIES: hypothetical protein [unclassified Fusibacter]MCK8061465.1 hypothetical protein [Fusibacter sp. A2]NPE23650.1 hypothetical protein [Fusibacter sp. A1]RXV58829.1 hypothetical protein DWB64_17850 [Fusibacter sp. A1]